MSTYKIGVLQQALDESVRATELEAANKQYNELTAKYRDIIQRENSLVARSAVVDNLEVGFVYQNHRACILRFLTSEKIVHLANLFSTILPFSECVKNDRFLNRLTRRP